MRPEESGLCGCFVELAMCVSNGFTSQVLFPDHPCIADFLVGLSTCGIVGTGFMASPMLDVAWREPSGIAYFLCFGFQVSAFAVLTSRNVGLIAGNDSIETVVQFATVLHMMTLGAAVAPRIANLKREKAVSSDLILAALGKAAEGTNRHSLDSVVARLRRKVESQTGAALPVKSVRAIGYIFASPCERRSAAPPTAK